MLKTNPDHAVAAATAGPRPTGQLLELALVMLAIAAATILGALGFEHIGGYQPCALCLMQRTPYYIGVPIGALAVIAVWMKAPKAVLVVLFAAFAIAMLYGGSVAVYHAGVEWKFWPGPAECSQSGAAQSAADLLAQLDTVVPASCSEAVWRFLGLSFAGWNVLVSALLAGIAFFAAHTAWRSA